MRILKTLGIVVLIALIGWLIGFFTIPKVQDWTMYDLLKIERPIETPEDETPINGLPAQTPEIGGDVIE